MEIALPLKLFISSPSISCPIWDQEPEISSNILTLPEEIPLSSFVGAPTATILPSELKETDSPKLSSGASPSISYPIW